LIIDDDVIWTVIKQEVLGKTCGIAIISLEVEPLCICAVNEKITVKQINVSCCAGNVLMVQHDETSPP
jgi:hypothetical protein